MDILIGNYEIINRRIFNSLNNHSFCSKKIDQLINNDSILTCNPTFTCVVNPVDLKVLHVDKNAKNCGISPSSLKLLGIKYLWGLMHKDDLQTLTTTLEDLLYYINNEMAIDDKLQYSYSWNYRIKLFNNEYLTMFQHTTPYICLDSKQKRSLKHFTGIRNNHKFQINASINSLDKYHNFRTLYSSNCSQKKFFSNISNREKDIVTLLTQNLSSKEISERLFISSNTVDTHRRNILRKLKLTSTGELKAILKTIS